MDAKPWNSLRVSRDDVRYLVSLLQPFHDVKWAAGERDLRLAVLLHDFKGFLAQQKAAEAIERAEAEELAKRDVKYWEGRKIE